MDINWFPGHMLKTKKLIINNINMVDIIIEILDARIPISSSNPDISTLTKGKKVITLLNKADLADPITNRKWGEYFKEKNKNTVLINSFNKKDISNLKKQISEFTNDKIFNQKEKGRKKYTMKVMIVGIPNVGKSTIINQIVNRKAAKASDKPGVTKGKQWIKLGSDILMLDTPGVLWPKFQDAKVGINLAITGAIKDEILDIQTLSLKYINFMKNNHNTFLEKRYNVNIDEKMSDLDIYEAIGRKRGFLIKGGEIDYERCAKIMLDEFRNGKIGRISLERPEDYE